MKKLLSSVGVGALVWGLGAAFAESTPSKPAETKVEYRAGDQVFEGYVVAPSRVAGKAPGVLVVHDWMGVREQTLEKARALAGLGYVAFVADIYGQGVRPKDAKQASELAGKYKQNRPLYREHLKAALEQLRAQSTVDPAKLGAIGYCFGGTGVIELARAGADVKGMVSFHGGLDSPDPTLGKNIKGRVLALHGADDPFVPAKDLEAFSSEMEKSGVKWKLVKYPGAVHSFTDRTAGTDNKKGAAYNEAADRQSWVAMKDFFKGVF